MSSNPGVETGRVCPAPVGSRTTAGAPLPRPNDRGDPLAVGREWPTPPVAQAYRGRAVGSPHVDRARLSAPVADLGENQLPAVLGQIKGEGIIEPGEIAVLGLSGSPPEKPVGLRMVGQKQTALRGYVVELEVSRHPDDQALMAGPIYRVERRLLFVLRGCEPHLPAIRSPARHTGEIGPSRRENAVPLARGLHEHHGDGRLPVENCDLVALRGEPG